MALVWQYGEKSGDESWKGLSWGMVGFSFSTLEILQFLLEVCCTVIKSVC